ncbi:MAG: hypothetical protein R3174_14170 [Gammaproteobacteria bacterium]|nr:hypothetical protein [Gammaproteobacteria bacterium]
MTSITARRTEEELRREIQQLRDRIAAASESTAASARSAISYLNQMLRDRRDELAILRRRQYH